MSGSIQAASPAENLLTLGRPLVIAHRGYSAAAPENTLAAFERASAAGADLIELDYHHSKDGVPIVIHDFTLDRTTDAVTRWGEKGLRVDARTAAELQTLDAGRWFHPPFPGLRLPLLTESLRTIQSNSVTLIERKAGDAATLAELLRSSNLVNRVVVQAFDWEYLREFRRLEPDQIIGALGPPSTRRGQQLPDAEKALSPAWLDEIQSLRAQIAVWNRQVDAGAVQAAHQRGLKVWVYTINDAATARRLLEAGVDGIITDNPAIIWKAVALRHSAP